MPINWDTEASGQTPQGNIQWGAPPVQKSGLQKTLDTADVFGKTVASGVNAVSSGVNKVYGVWGDLLKKTGAPQAVGGAVGSLGGLVGGATGALGELAHQGLTGQKIDIGKISDEALKSAKSTAQFGYQGGEQGAIAAPLGGASRLITAPFALSQLSSGGQQIAQGIKDKDYAEAVQGGLTAGTGLLMTRGLTEPSKGLLTQSGKLEGAVKRTLTASERSLSNNVSKAIGVKGKIMPTDIPKAVDAFRTISDNAKNTTVLDESGNSKLFNPRKATFAETVQALKQTKDSVYKEYSDLAKKAGDEGASFTQQDFSSVIKKLQDTAKDSTSAFKNKVGSLITDLQQNFGTLNPKTGEFYFKNTDFSRMQSFLEKVNTDVNPVSDKAGATVSATASKEIRRILDDKISQSTGGEYQALRNKYSNLKVVEDGLLSQWRKAARKIGGGIGGWVEGFGALDTAVSLMTGNVAGAVKGGLLSGLGGLMNHLRDPETFLKRSFRQIDTQTANPPMTLPKAPAQMGLSIKDVNTMTPEELKANNLAPKFDPSKIKASSGTISGGDFMKEIESSINPEQWKVNYGIDPYVKGEPTFGPKEARMVKPEVASHAIDDIAAKYDYKYPNSGLGDVFRKIAKETLDVNDTTLEDIGQIAKEVYSIIEPNAGKAQGLATKLKATDDARNQINLEFMKQEAMNNPKTEGAIPPTMTSYKETGELTTKVLKKLEGRTTVSKQFISDLTNSPDLKQSERDLIRNTLKNEGNIVSVKDFADKVKTELLPLERTGGMEKGGENVGMHPAGAQGGVRYESITLPPELRGPVANYGEHVYQSPIKTSAGDVHFSGEGADNYFAHTRIEDTPGNTRRVIELQSDLFQKGRLEGEANTVRRDGGKELIDKRLTQRAEEIKPLEPYRNTWHERVIREEVKQAAKDGKTKLQFPTGETAMKIEGLGDTKNWMVQGKPRPGGLEKLTSEKLTKGLAVTQQGGGTWIITDVLGDGRFKAAPKERMSELSGTRFGQKAFNDISELPESYKETFNISGKVDFDGEIPTPENIKQIIQNLTNKIKEAEAKGDTQRANLLDGIRDHATVYKFYAVDVPKYLKNKLGAKTITDKQGVTWNEVPIKKEWGKMPIEALGLALIGVGTAVASVLPTKKKK